jgi:hypothetical protein
MILGMTGNIQFNFPSKKHAVVETKLEFDEVPHLACTDMKMVIKKARKSGKR